MGTSSTVSRFPTITRATLSVGRAASSVLVVSANSYLLAMGAQIESALRRGSLPAADSYRSSISMEVVISMQSWMVRATGRSGRGACEPARRQPAFSDRASAGIEHECVG